MTSSSLSTVDAALAELLAACSGSSVQIKEAGEDLASLWTEGGFEVVKVVAPKEPQSGESRSDQLRWEGAALPFLPSPLLSSINSAQHLIFLPACFLGIYQMLSSLLKSSTCSTPPRRTLSSSLATPPPRPFSRSSDASPRPSDPSPPLTRPPSGRPSPLRQTGRPTTSPCSLGTSSSRRRCS